MAAIDLRSKFGPVEQQGSGNACVAHAVTSAIEATLGVSDLSRLFVYYNARALANQTGYDAGCQPRNAVKGVTTFGAPLELYCPYDSTKVLLKPSAEAYNAAVDLKTRIKAYQAVTSLAAMKAAMLAGQPVVFGLLVPDTFPNVRYTGVVPMWNSTTKWIGRHAMVTAGFDDATGNVLVRNSFGPTWGKEGYCEMPFAWFSTISSTSKVSDCWTFVKV